MQFHLGFIPAVSAQKITHNDGLLLIGSCFSEHIGNHLNDFKFDVNTNPLGIVFNPKSIETALNRIIHKTFFTKEDVFEKEDLWYTFEAHSSISATTAEELIIILNESMGHWHEKLKHAHWLMITFGTAFAYQELSKNAIVANCHKLPQAHFNKVLLQSEDIVETYTTLLEQLRQFNSHLHVLFTVSPVKHLRDGVVENNLSKAILIQSVHALIKNQPHCVYFPAYELVNDDLRDYRFYESDMAHPNKQAIEYVWKRFAEVYFNPTTLSINEKVLHIHQAYRHRLLKETTESSSKFKHKFYQKCVILQSEFPHLNLSKELQYFNTYQD